MAVSTYNNNNCRYRLDKLDKVVYLISEDDLRNIHIDDGEAFVDGVTAEPLSLKVYNIALADTDELDERYKFTHQLTFSVNGYANYRDFQGKYFVIVKSLDGVYWLVNPLFPCKVTYTYNLDANGSHTDFTLSTASNHPTLRIVDFEKLTPRNCIGYSRCTFKSLKLNENKYSLKSGNNIKYTNDGFKDVVFDRNSASFTEQFDGNNISHSLQFNIKFDDYKSSWHYNLLEFMDNAYASIIENSCGKYILCGFGFGLRPSFNVTANDEATPDNIQIQLVDIHDNGDLIGYYDEIEVSKDENIRFIYTAEHDGYECVGVNTARYLLKKEVDILGNPTGRYMCLEGYESQFSNLNIVGTFATTEEFVSPSCGGQVCRLQTSFPSSFIFNTKSCRTYSLMADSDWSISSSNNGITVTPNHGVAKQSYTVEVCNTIEPASTPISASLTVSYCDKTQRYDVTIEKGNSCFTAGQVFDISANGQYVTVPTSCCIQAVTDSSSTVSNITIQNAYFKVYVPQNNTGSIRVITLTVTLCNMTTAEVIINQGIGFERWIKESTTCVGNQKCDVERKYTGTTASDINTRTSETRTSNCAVSSECSGQSTRWVNTTETTCSGGKKYIVQAEQTSSDGGQTWTLTGNKRLGAETADSPAECEGTETYEDWRVEGYVCEDTTKYQRERLYTSTDNINWIATNTYRKTSVVLETNSEDCGYIHGSDTWKCDKWELDDGYICESTTKYAREQRFVRDCNDCNNCEDEWIATGIYRRTQTVLEQNSEDCGYVIPSTAWTCSEWRVVENDYICEDGTKYTKERKYVRDCEDCDNCSAPWNETDVYRRGATVLEENSTDCGYDPSVTGNCSDYQWLGDFICDGYSKYQYLQKFVRDCADCNNCSAEWIATSIKKRGDLIEESSIDCGYIPSGTYEKWEEDGYMCDGYSKYKKLRRYISEDNIQWYQTNTFKRGSLIEDRSFDCGYIPTEVYYEWRAVDTMCDGFNKYYRERKYISDDGSRWYETDIYRQGALIESNSADCGYTPRIEYEYQWVITTQTICVGYNKYYLYKRQRRIKNSGSAWEDVIPTETSYNGNGTMQPQLIEADSPDCGYTPPVEPQYDWRVVQGYICASCDGTEENALVYTYFVSDPSYIENGSSECSQGISYSGHLLTATIGTCITSIGERAFASETMMHTVRIPSTVTSIGNSAFIACRGLIDMTLPNSIQTIGNSAFQGCIQLSSMSLPNSLQNIGEGAFQGCQNLLYINIPSMLTTISNYAFNECTGLSDIVIPRNVESIGYSAFANCNGASYITIEGTYVTIYGSAFNNCTRLKKITVKSQIPPIMDGAAFENTNNCPICVPSGSVEAYKAAEGWSRYASRIQAIS